jgi:hypothetical protein
VSDNDRQLISLELDAIFGLTPGVDGTGHILLDRDKKAVFAWSPFGRVFALNPDIGIDFVESAGGREEDYVPAALPQTVKEIAEAVRDADPDSPVTVEGGPTYVIPRAAPLAPPLPEGVEIIGSDPAGRDTARLLHRPDNWGPDEWPDLVEGRLGAWAMAVRDAEPVAICFTPAANARVAEAGACGRGRTAVATGLQVRWCGPGPMTSARAAAPCSTALGPATPHLRPSPAKWACRRWGGYGW